MGYSRRMAHGTYVGVRRERRSSSHQAFIGRHGFDRVHDVIRLEDRLRSGRTIDIDAVSVRASG